MKKCLILTGLILGLVGLAHSAIVTNTNQSASYLRFPARNAAVDFDSVYYNPAGVVKLSDGFHIAIHNQTIFQEKTIVNEFPRLNEGEYIGKVDVPVFPTLFAVYKKNKFALSFGFGPNGGGGSAKFDTGLPSFETSIAQLPALVSGMGIPTSQYNADIAFEGSSIYYGFQVNASYAMSDAFALAFGIRYISAVNTYEGHLGSIQINPTFPALGLNGSMIPAVNFFTAVGQPAYAAMVKDKQVDVKQTGTGFTPIWSLFATPVKNLNLSLRYENGTNLVLTNETTIDDTGMFPNGEKSGNDIPAILAFGAQYVFSPKFKAGLTYNTYLDKDADWDGREMYVDKNGYELGLALEYQLTSAIALSAGYQLTKDLVSPDYQTDMSFQMPSDFFGAGARINLGSKLVLDLGAFMVDYKDASKMISYGLFGTHKETYKQKAVGVSIGLGYRI